MKNKKIMILVGAIVVLAIVIIGFITKTILENGKSINIELDQKNFLGAVEIKSDADFILFYSKLPLYDILLDRGILIRDCSNYVGLSQGYFRVAVKTYDENVRLLKVIGECIEKN